MAEWLSEQHRFLPMLGLHVIPQTPASEGICPNQQVEIELESIAAEKELTDMTAGTGGDALAETVLRSSSSAARDSRFGSAPVGSAVDDAAAEKHRRALALEKQRKRSALKKARLQAYAEKRVVLGPILSLFEWHERKTYTDGTIIFIVFFQVLYEGLMGRRLCTHG